MIKTWNHIIEIHVPEGNCPDFKLQITNYDRIVLVGNLLEETHLWHFVHKHWLINYLPGLMGLPYFDKDLNFIFYKRYTGWMKFHLVRTIAHKDELAVASEMIMNTEDIGAIIHAFEEELKEKNFKH